MRYILSIRGGGIRGIIPTCATVSMYKGCGHSRRGRSCRDAAEPRVGERRVVLIDAAIRACRAARSGLGRGDGLDIRKGRGRQWKSGAGAIVTVKNLDTGVTRTATTDDEGDYRILALPLGGRK